jgi:iron complex outermembrane receptor protein
MSGQLLSCGDIHVFQCTDALGAIFTAGEEQALGFKIPEITVGGVNPGQGEQSWHDYGVFGQATYAILDNLKFTGGLRWSDDITNGHNTKYTYLFPNVVGTAPIGGSFPLFFFPNGPNNKPFVSTTCTQFPQATLAGNCTVGLHQSSRAPTWVMDLEYAPIEDLNTYVKYSRGYRAGGISPDGPAGTLNYGKETVDAYEVGAKAAFHGEVSGFLNVAAFYNDFSNQQLPEGFEGKPGTGVSSTIAIVNAPSSTIDGFEIEGALNPYKNLTFTYGYTYLNARLGPAPVVTLPDSSPYGSKSLFVTGQPLPFSPRHKATAAIDYVLPLDPDIGKVTFDINYTYTANQLVSVPAPVGFAFIPSSSLFNLNLSWENIYGSPLDLGFFITNLMDRVIRNNVVDFVDQGLGWDSIGLAPPRMVGGRLKYKFGVPSAPSAAPSEPAEPAPPPPPPAPVAAAPEAQRQFQVFFDFDKSDITSAASQVISAAADTVKSGHIATVSVTGHTDTVGTVKYNQALSERRAAAVKAALIADGVAADEITAAGVGKSDLLVPTGDGVREPQNRRAVILMGQAQS